MNYTSENHTAMSTTIGGFSCKSFFDKAPLSSKKNIFLTTTFNGKKCRVPLKQKFLEEYVEKICESANTKYVEVARIVNNVYPKLKDVNSICDIDEQIISSVTDMSVYHYEYEKIAVHLLVRDLHKSTSDDYLQIVTQLYNNVDKNDKHKPIISSQFFNFVKEHHEIINSKLNYDLDYKVSLFGFRTLEKAYLKKKCTGQIIERPQHLFMRVAIAIHYRFPPSESVDFIINKIFETYELLSLQYFIHATPTLFNAGSNYEQLSSCFLLGIEDDMEKVGECWKDCAIISKFSGGIGIHVTNLRVSGAYVNSTQGKASGMKFASVFNNISRCANQGGRPGSFALYIEPWHGDVEYFLNLKKNTGAETDRARDLFFGLVINDIFMKRVEDDDVWSLMCPSECPDLLNKFGEEFTQIYESYEKQGKFLFQMKARNLWFKILEAQIETGTPYILFKDATNKKSNQSNIGVINGSNLCVGGNTMILTSDGYEEISKICGKTIKVWNGIEFSETVVARTGRNQSLTAIKFSNGSYLTCTPYHKFYIQRDEKEVIVKRTHELNIGDQLVPTTYPVITKPKTSLDSSNFQGVPVNKNLDQKIEYLKSYINNYSDTGEIQSHDFTWITNLKYMLQTMGADPHVRSDTNGFHKLIFSKTDILKLKSLGLDLNERDDTLSTLVVTVEEICPSICIEDTYCFNEPLRHLGIFNGIICGNCIEIVEVSNSDEYAVCNLASICLPRFIVDSKIDYKKLFDITKIITRNLNNVIDINFYPSEKARKSNMKHRPIGIGVQGLADVFMILGLGFCSAEARDINKKIFETIYFGFVTASMELAKVWGPYETFEGSPMSKGQFQFNLWGISESDLSGMWDWVSLRADVMRWGVRNSLGTACMPTASTSQIMGCTESVEACTSNIFGRSTQAGDFYVINKYLIDDLTQLGLWNDDMVDIIKYYEGSIQHIDFIPDAIKEIYKTVWEIEQYSIAEMAADRGLFVDQTQSMNIHMARNAFYSKEHFTNQPLNARLTSSHFYAWKLGLKTGIYYLRTKPASEPDKFGIDIEKIQTIFSHYNLKIIPQLLSTDIDTSKNKKKSFTPEFQCTEKECTMCSS